MYISFPLQRDKNQKYAAQSFNPQCHEEKILKQYKCILYIVYIIESHN